MNKYGGGEIKMKKIRHFSLIVFAFIVVTYSSLFSRVLIIDDFNQPTQYNSNNLNDLGGWTDDDGTFSPGNTYDKVTNCYGRTNIKLNWTSADDYWYSVLNNTGYDVSSYDYISFKVRSTNSTGNINFRVVLRDANNVFTGKDTYNDLYYTIRTNWIIVQARLSIFSGVNMSILKSVAFDTWGVSSSKIFVDDLAICDAIVINNIDSTNLTSGEKDETYFAGETVRIWITETSNFVGLNGTITISNTSGYKTNASLTDAGDGKYYFHWNTTGLLAGNYIVETTLGNNYVYDDDGYNNTGADLLIQLQEQMNPRAMWVWDIATTILYDWGYAREDLFDFCAAPPKGVAPVGIIYMNVTPAQLSSASSYVKSLVSEAHNRGLKIYWLSGENNWGQPDDSGKGTNSINTFVDYNTNAAANERFDGVDLDVEIHTYSPSSGHWYDDPGAFGNYLNFIEYATNKFRRCKQLDANFKFGVDIPYYYDTSPCTNQYQKVIDRVDYISMMDYKDSANLIYTLATNELAYATSVGKKVRIGVETQNLGAPLDGNTFYEEGWEYMENTLSTVRSNVSSYAAFDREVIHYYDSYAQLLPYRIDVVKNTEIQSYGILQGETNKTVMSIHITSDNNLTYLIGMKITNKGNATSSDIENIKVWNDNGTTANEWDSSDTLIGYLSYDSSKSLWTNKRFHPAVTNYLGFLGVDAVLTVDIATNGVGGRTFQAEIIKAGVLGSGRATGDSDAVINSGIQTIANISTNWSKLRINEVQINAPSINPPTDNEPYWEWIEIYNTSPNIVDLSGCMIGDTYPNNHYWQIPEGTLIDGYGFKVFYGYQFNPTLDTNNGVAFLNNNSTSTEKVLLYDPYTNIVDIFDYSGLNVGENDIYGRKVDGFGPFYDNSTNISYNDVWVTAKTDNSTGTTNYFSTKGEPNAKFLIINNSSSNKVAVNNSLNFTIKASNLLDNRVVTNYSGYNYVAFLSINGGGIIPSITTNGFTNGYWTGDIQFADPGEFTLTAYYGATIGNISFITVYVPGAPPLSVSEIDVKQNPGHLPALSLFLNSMEGGKEIAVHIVGVDGQPAKLDATTVYIKASVSDAVGINATLWETGTNTGVYTNKVILSTNSDDAYNIIKATNVGETIYAISEVGSLTDTFLLANTPLGLIDAYESQPYNEATATIHYEDDMASTNYGNYYYDNNIFYPIFGTTNGTSMRFDFNIGTGEYCWVENDVGGIDVTSYTSLNFMVRRGTDTGPNDCKVQISSMLSNDWQKVLIRDYVSGGSITTSWLECNIPLSVFTIPFKGKLDNIAFIADVSNSQGSLYIDNLRFLPSKATNLVFMSNNFIKILIETNVSIGATLYLQLESTVMNPNTVDTTPIFLQSSSDTNGLMITLTETSRNSGIYRGIAYLGFNTTESNNILGATWGDYIYLRSYDNTLLLDKLKVISSNQRLKLLRFYPTNNSIGISLTSKITATFNLPILSSTVTDNFILYDSENSLIPYQSIDVVNGTNVVFTPLNPLDPNEFFKVVVTTNIQDSIYGSFIDKTTNSYFKTTTGWETFHYYNTIDLNQNEVDWIIDNSIEIHTNRFEKIAEDIIFPSESPPIIATHKFFVTWDSNSGGNPSYLYMAFEKNNNGNAKDVWYDYIVLDVTRDFYGATNFINGTFTNSFREYRRPEYIIKVTHDVNAKYWNNIESFKWDGSGWVAGPDVFGTTNIPFTNSSMFEMKIALTNLSPPNSSSDKIPNRVAIVSWVNQDGYSSPLDYCEEESGFLTFSPDNNGDDIPDGMQLAATVVTITKSYSIPTLAVPGATVTFSIYYTNELNDAVGFKISDVIQPGLKYVPNSLKIGLSSGTYDTAQTYTDDIGDDIASFQLPGTITFVPSNGTAPDIGGYLPSNSSGICYFRATIESNIPIGSLISNMASVSGNKFTNTNSNQIMITVVSTNAPNLKIEKSISNVFLGAGSNSPIPGATILYKVSFSNIGNSAASNVVIYDHIPVNVIYSSNSSASPAGWTNQFSTNTDPDQSYSSTDYKNTEPVSSNVQWIRWKRSSIAVDESGSITYKVIIK